jgi:beta-glucosidase
MVRDPADEQRIADLLSRMTLEEKVGQVIQADIAFVTPDDVREYNLGSVLNGGGSAPQAGRKPQAWLDLADQFWDASTDTTDGGVGIPAIWGTDAVHGHSNVVGATIFPHNIGLGAANDADLMYDIGRVTALEMLSTGLDWTFAPTIAVVRNDRWGRTYESYSEDPAIVAAFAPRIVEGIQGRLGTDEFLGEGRMIATAKHYAGDGGTTDGKDQGDTIVAEEQFRDIQAAGYPPAVAAGVQSVMASFNSFHGRKMHGHKEMLTDVLVGRFGFDGFTVGDWNGHGQVAGCTNTSCAASFNAGLDMFMAPDSWKGLYESMLKDVASGAVTMERLDEAVARILRVKLRMGVFEAGRPSSRPGAGDFALMGSADHRAVARRGVRQSLVLLKNENTVLPIKPQSKVLVTGSAADDIGQQSGGWTLSWQGSSDHNADFPNGQSIYHGIAEAVAAAGGVTELSTDGSFNRKPDVAVVVFGEDPYAEFQGDRADVDYAPEDGLSLLRKFKAQGIPTVAVLISGRPLWVNPELNSSDAFVAAWLPGSEGGGVADVLVAGPDGNAQHDFSGRLSFSWPRTAGQVQVNLGDADYNPLFQQGYGLDYATGGSVGELPEDPGSEAGGGDVTKFLEYGDPSGPWSLVLRDADGDTRITDSRGTSSTGALSISPADRVVQEDSIVLAWSAPASLVMQGLPADFTRESNGDMAIELAYQVLEAPAAGGAIAMGDGTSGQGAIATDFAALAGSGWRTALLKLSCFAAQGAPMENVAEALVISGDAGLKLQIASARIVANPGDAGCAPRSRGEIRAQLHDPEHRKTGRNALSLRPRFGKRVDEHETWPECAQ